VASLDGAIIYLHDLPFAVCRSNLNQTGTDPSSLKTVQNMAEKDAICCALKEVAYNKSRAARNLGIHRTHLYKKMRKYGLPLQTETRISKV